eukprot:Gb_28761 [translate_table: standard]
MWKEEHFVSHQRAFISWDMEIKMDLKAVKKLPILLGFVREVDGSILSNSGPTSNLGLRKKIFSLQDIHIQGVELFMRTVKKMVLLKNNLGDDSGSMKEIQGNDHGTVSSNSGDAFGDGSWGPAFIEGNDDNDSFGGYDKCDVGTKSSSGISGSTINADGDRERHLQNPLFGSGEFFFFSITSHRISIPTRATDNEFSTGLPASSIVRLATGQSGRFWWVVLGLYCWCYVSFAVNVMYGFCFYWYSFLHYGGDLTRKGSKLDNEEITTLKKNNKLLEEESDKEEEKMKIC